tara:strand:- start:1396 stop:2949 length:1554 start_codon:yes stop_codon:yes gene_type:complete
MKQFMEVSPNEYHEILETKRIIQSDDNYNYTEYYYACSNYGVNSWRRYENMDYTNGVREIVNEDKLKDRHEQKWIHTREEALEAFKDSKYGSLDDIVDSLIHNDDVRFDQTSALAEFLKSTTHREYNGLNDSNLVWSDITKILSIFNPTECPKNKGQIAMFLTHKDKLRDRVTTMKGGKAIRRMFAHLTNQHVASITEDWIEQSKPREFELVYSEKAEDFLAAYEHSTVSYRNPRLAAERKNLATSCMQQIGRHDDYDCEGEYFSVGEAYASGDFGILYLKDKKNHIAGRTVIGIHRKGVDVAYVHQSMYGACEQSLDMMKQHLDFMGSTFHNDTCDGWTGLKLKVLGDVHDPIVPYVDGEYRCDLIRNNGKQYFVLNDDGEFSLTETDGTLSHGHTCDNCGELEEDMCTTPEGESYCRYCFEENYTECEVTNQTIHNEDSIYAWMNCGTNADGADILREVDMHIDESVFVEFTEEYWYAGDCSLHEETQEFIPSHLFEDYVDYYEQQQSELELETA